MVTKKIVCVTLGAMALMAVCSAKQDDATPAPGSKIAISDWGTTKKGAIVKLFTMTTPKGTKLVVSNYGATIVQLWTKNKDGVASDVVLGFKTLREYEDKSPYFGCIVGRYGNRIGGAKFSLGGKTYKLAANNSPAGMPCNLHGGIQGFDKRVWVAKVPDMNDPAIEMTYVSPDKEEGFPGRVTLKVVYRLISTPKGDVVRMEYSATSTKPTPFNPTNHAYFNLEGEGNGLITNHLMQIFADKITPVNKGLIPTGAYASVAGTPFDFRKPQSIGSRIGAKNTQLQYGGGYDHNFVLATAPRQLTKAARVVAPKSGRVLEVYTTEPGLQFYSGNFLDGTLVGKRGQKYLKRSGFCLETQHFPDSPNKPKFPTTILRPGKTFKSVTDYWFSTVPAK
jgi:aldose 1-epimerase